MMTTYTPFVNAHLFMNIWHQPGWLLYCPSNGGRTGCNLCVLTTDFWISILSLGFLLLFILCLSLLFLSVSEFIDFFSPLSCAGPSLPLSCGTLGLVFFMFLFSFCDTFALKALFLLNVQFSLCSHGFLVPDLIVSAALFRCMRTFLQENSLPLFGEIRNWNLPHSI